jgi:hypothetical protein
MWPSLVKIRYTELNKFIVQKPVWMPTGHAQSHNTRRAYKNDDIVKDHPMIIHVPFVFNQKSCHSEDFFLLFIFPYGHMLKL